MDARVEKLLKIPERTKDKDDMMRAYVKKLCTLLTEKGYISNIAYIFDSDGDEYGIKVYLDPVDKKSHLEWVSLFLDNLDYFPTENIMTEIVKGNMGEKMALYRKAKRRLSYLSYENVRRLLQPYFVKTNLFSEFIDRNPGCPHRSYIDLTVAYYIQIDDVYLTVTNPMAERFGIDEETLYRDSLSNIVLDVHGGILEKSLEFVCKDKCETKSEIPMMVISSKNSAKGGNVILRSDFLENIAKSMDDDLYIMLYTSCAWVIPKKALSEDTGPLFLTEYHKIREELDEPDENDVWVDEHWHYSSDGSDVYEYCKESNKLEKAFKKTAWWSIEEILKRL